MAATPDSVPAAKKGGFRAWLNKRLPVDEFVESQLTGYYAPKNFNIWYFFGALSLMVFVLQIVSGIFLTMHYKPSEAEAFNSVEYIMREVEWGWLIRYMHSTGASFFFIVIYLHMFRAMMYGSYRGPRELLWIFGMVIYLALMAEAFMGYVLPWGNMSYWGAQVIVNLFGTIPVIGPGLVEWIRGDYGIADSTLNRFFALHVIAVPFAIALLIALHLVALRQTGSNNPDGIEIKAKIGADGKPIDGIPFHPYYTVKDLVGVGVFLLFFCGVIFFVPTFGGLFLEKPNFEPANALSTPAHIAPVWYFTAYYAMLRAVPDQQMGALLMLCSLVVFFFLPWLDRSPVKSIRYKGILSKIFLTLFVISFIGLSYLGLMPAEPIYVVFTRIFTVLYFAFFLLMPWYTSVEKCKPAPERVTYHA
jgi:ubiquinol-cytochrome c reductase cytochrome b subunit